MVESLNKRIEENADKMIQSLCEVVQIPSVYGKPQPGAPFGKESRRALQYAMDLGKKLGFETVVNVDDQVCYIEYGTGTKTVGVFAHLDVVPEGKGWTYPPFGGEIHNHRVYGRGTVDNKGPYIASLYALYAIKELGLPLGDWKIRIVGGTNEEGLYRIEQRNKFSVGEQIEVMKPDGENIEVTVKRIVDEEGNDMESAPHPKQVLYIDLGHPLEMYDILRRKE